MLINSPNISGSLTVTGNATISGSLTVAGGINATITGSATSASYVEYSNVANKPTLVSGSEQVSFNGIIDKPTLVSGSEQVSFSGIVDKPALVSGSSQVTYSGLSGIPSGIVSSSTQITGYNIFATTGSNQFNGSQAITGSLTVTGQVVAQTLNVQQVTSSIVYSSGSNIFGNSLDNTQQFTGSVSVTGSLTVAGAGTFASSVTAGNNLLINNLAASKKGYTYQSPASNWGPQVSGLYFTPNNATDAKTTFTLELWNGVGSIITPLTIADTGAATFSSSVRATADASGRSGFFGGTSFGLRIDNSGSFNNGGSIIHGVDNTFVASYQKLSLNGSSLEFMTDYGTKLTIANSGAATFSSSVTANNLGFVATNGYGITSYSGATASGANIIFGAGVYNTFDGIYQSSGATRDFGIWLNGGTINDPKFVIKNSGAVGIGLTNPGAILDVSHTAGTTNIIRVSNGAGNYRWRVDQNFSMIMTNASNVDTFSVTTAGDITGKSFRISNGGFRGGTFAYPDVIGSGSDNSLTIFAEGGANQGNIYFCPNGSATRVMTINTSSNVLIGTTSGNGAKLQVEGSVTASSFSTSGFIKSHSTTKTFHVQTTLNERLSNANYFKLQSTLGGGFQVIVYTFSQSTGIGWFGSQIFQAVTIPFFGGWAGDSTVVGSNIGGQSGVITSAVIGNDGSITFRVSTSDNGTNTQSTINSYIQVSAFQVDGITLTTF
jgi:hypothetical protein